MFHGAFDSCGASHGMSIGMLATQTLDGETHSRPMLVHDVDESGWLWFLTDRHRARPASWARTRTRRSHFNPERRSLRFVQGTAIVVRDDVRLQELWNPTLRSWFPRGRRDPEIVLVAVRVMRAEYWLVPRTRMVRVIGMAKAMLTGRRQEAGRHGVLDLHPLIA